MKDVGDDDQIAALREKVDSALPQQQSADDQHERIDAYPPPLNVASPRAAAEPSRRSRARKEPVP